MYPHNVNIEEKENVKRKQENKARGILRVGK